LNEYSNNILITDDNVIIFPFYYQNNLIVTSLKYDSKSNTIRIEFVNIILSDKNMTINHSFMIKEINRDLINTNLYKIPSIGYIKINNKCIKKKK
jgi:hypothetical protein